MSYKMFLDDERYPTTPDWLVARSSFDAVHFVSNFGMPKEIAFDHDLGGADTSMVFLRWLEEELIQGRVEFPENFSYTVHSQNPVGATNIMCHMESLLKYF